MVNAKTTAQSHSWTRLDGVDLLRGLSILFVLMNHVNVRLVLNKVPYTQGFPRQLVNSLVYNAQFGVQMFFAISGFLITLTSLRRWGPLPNIRVPDFYRLRFARIAPLFLLLLAILSSLHLLGVTNFVFRETTGGLSRALLAALTFHVNVLEANRGYLPGNWDILWSLSVEEMFYLFFPLLCFLLGGRKLLVPVLVGFMIAGPFDRSAAAGTLWQDYSYLGRMDAIAMGCLTALLVSRFHLSRRTLQVVGYCGVAIMVFILCMSRLAYRWSAIRNGLDMSVLALGACMVIAVAAQTQWKSPRLLSPIVRLGQRSYEVYLTHMFVVFGLLAVFLRLGKPMWAVPCFFVCTILIAAVLGELTARFFSEPMNRYLRKRFGADSKRLGSAVETISEEHEQETIPSSV